MLVFPNKLDRTGFWGGVGRGGGMERWCSEVGRWWGSEQEVVQQFCLILVLLLGQSGTASGCSSKGGLSLSGLIGVAVALPQRRDEPI